MKNTKNFISKKAVNLIIGFANDLLKNVNGAYCVAFTHNRFYIRDNDGRDLLSVGGSFGRYNSKVAAYRGKYSPKGLAISRARK
jgi:hypothetical protein